MTDPDYRGDSLTPSETYVLAATSENQTISAAYVVSIRNIDITFSGTGPWRVRLYDTSTRASGDLVFDSGSQDASITSYVDATPRIYRDGSNASSLYLTIDGQIGDSITVAFELFKLS